MGTPKIFYIFAQVFISNEWMLFSAKSLKYFIFKIFELAYIHLFVKFRKGNNVLNLLKMCKHLLYLKFILCAKLERKLNLAWPCIFFLNQVEMKTISVISEYP